MVTIAALTGGAMVLRDLGVVVALFGALLGSCVIYIFPALMYMQAFKAKATGVSPVRRVATLRVPCVYLACAWTSGT